MPVSRSHHSIAPEHRAWERTSLTSEIEQRLLAFICDSSSSTDATFNTIALELFAHQFERNAPFRRFAQNRGRTPHSVRHWHDIPAVPIDAFKSLTLCCCTQDRVARVFMTSGTTQGVKGKSFHSSLEVYDASMQHNFARRFMRGGDKIDMGILFPDEHAMPNSSLAHYLELALVKFGTQRSHNLFNGTDLDIDRTIATLTLAEQRGEPYALLGASFSFVPLLDRLRESKRTFRLAPGSRILDTGGFKGQSRELSLEDFYNDLSEFFGVPHSHCINMYGMTELSTQFYDDGNVEAPALKSGPHWIRSRAIDPLSGQAVAPGETGVLVHCDLAHYNIVTSILTEDLGREANGGFYLLGRAHGAEAKGCSIAVEEFLQATR